MSNSFTFDNLPLYYDNTNDKSVNQEDTYLKQYDNENNEQINFNTIETIRNLHISQDKLTATYVGKGLHSTDVGVIRANKPFNSTTNVCYFEITLVDCSESAKICIGLTLEKFPLNKHPGWESNSYGFHGTDGKKIEDAEAERYGNGFKKDDIVGCGYHNQKKEVFFTHNGKYLGVAFKKVYGRFYATIGLHSANESVFANFGQEKFAFNLQGMINKEQQQYLIKVKQNTSKIDISKPNSIVLDYLSHFGYKNTLDKLNVALNNQPTQHEQELISLRENFKNCINDGKIKEGKALLKKYYPSYLDFENNDDINNNNNSSSSSNSNSSNNIEDDCDNINPIEKPKSKLSKRIQQAKFLVYSQEIIEMIKADDLINAVLLSRKISVLYSSLSPIFDRYLKKVVSLLAYQHEHLINQDSEIYCPIRYLLSNKHKELVIDSVNAAISMIETGEEYSQLEKLMRQLNLVQEKSKNSNDYIENILDA